MLRKALRQNTAENRLIRLVLVFALIFAAAHVALHELDMGSGNSDHHCQVCRLNQMPAASLAAPSLLVPLLLLAHLLPVEDKEYQLSRPFHSQWARAPPLF